MKIKPTIEDLELVEFCPEFEDIQTIEDYQKYFLAYIPEEMYHLDDYLVKKVAVQDDGYMWPVEGLKYSLQLVEWAQNPNRDYCDFDYNVFVVTDQKEVA